MTVKTITSPIAKNMSIDKISLTVRTYREIEFVPNGDYFSHVPRWVLVRIDWVDDHIILCAFEYLFVILDDPSIGLYLSAHVEGYWVVHSFKLYKFAMMCNLFTWFTWFLLFRCLNFLLTLTYHVMRKIVQL